jgi:hypothetical protein
MGNDKDGLQSEQKAKRRRLSQKQLSLEREKLLSKQAAGTIVAPTTLSFSGYVDLQQRLSSQSMEFFMTIRLEISSLTEKQRNILLAVAILEALSEGVDLSLYMTLEFLYFSLKKVQDPIFIKEENKRRNVLLAELLLSQIRGDWINLGDRSEIPDEVKAMIESTGWLPKERTIASWKVNYNLRKYFSVRIVPIEQHINRDKLSSAERYTGYTRGYGNDGSPANPGKTKPTPELDGETPDLDAELASPLIPLSELEVYQKIYSSIEIRKAQIRQRK